MIELSARAERLLLLFPLACAVIAAFGGPLPAAPGTAHPAPAVAESASTPAQAARPGALPAQSVAHRDGGGTPTVR